MRKSINFPSEISLPITGRGNPNIEQENPVIGRLASVGQVTGQGKPLLDRTGDSGNLPTDVSWPITGSDLLSRPSAGHGIELLHKQVQLLDKDI